MVSRRFLARFIVRVNSLSPGGFRTEETPAQLVRNYLQCTPLRRMAEADDLKGPVVFLASEASRYITGQNPPVDSGWTAICSTFGCGNFSNCIRLFEKQEG